MLVIKRKGDRRGVLHATVDDDGHAVVGDDGHADIIVLVILVQLLLILVLPHSFL